MVPRKRERGFIPDAHSSLSIEAWDLIVFSSATNSNNEKIQGLYLTHCFWWNLSEFLPFCCILCSFAQHCSTKYSLYLVSSFPWCLCSLPALTLLLFSCIFIWRAHLLDHTGPTSDRELAQSCYSVHSACRIFGLHEVELHRDHPEINVPCEKWCAWSKRMPNKLRKSSLFNVLQRKFRINLNFGNIGGGWWGLVGVAYWWGLKE